MPATLTDILRNAIDAQDGEIATLQVHLANLLLQNPDRTESEVSEAFDLCCRVTREDPGNVEALELASKASYAMGARERADRYLDVADRLTRPESVAREALT